MGKGSNSSPCHCQTLLWVDSPVLIFTCIMVYIHDCQQTSNNNNDDDNSNDVDNDNDTTRNVSYMHEEQRLVQLDLQ